MAERKPPRREGEQPEDEETRRRFDHQQKPDGEARKAARGAGLACPDGRPEKDAVEASARTYHDDERRNPDQP